MLLRVNSSDCILCAYVETLGQYDTVLCNMEGIERHLDRPPVLEVNIPAACVPGSQALGTNK